MKALKADLVSTNLGSIILITPHTARGRAWMRLNVPDSRETPDGAVDCDHRFGVDILLGAMGAGLRLQDSETGRTA